jgi:hypothetical protein
MGYSDFLFTFGLLFSALDAYNIGPFSLLPQAYH